MKTSIAMLPSLFASCIFLALVADSQAEDTSKTAVALRGGVYHVPVALARLDPGWWKATTPTTTTTAAPAKKNASAEEKSAPSGPASIFDVQIEQCTPFLNIPGTFLANFDYWKDECKSVPSGATYLKLTLGKTSDYFKPKASKSMCDMLMSGDQHMWSSDGKYGWKSPTSHSTVGLGGSGDGWLTKTSPSDKRDTPSFWGVTNFAPKESTGGCCHADYSAAGKAWTKPFQMEYCGLPKALAPICTPMTTVAGSFSADKDFWAVECKKLPMTASYIKVAMGGSVDYYRPPVGKTMCEMLTANLGTTKIHKWSKDGQTWVQPTYDTTAAFGGSADGTLSGDGRKKVSFWGSGDAANTGGCCYSSLYDKKPGFGKSFTMSYCEMATATPVSQLVSLLHSNEAAIQSLETTLSDLHTRLSNAETVDVDAAGNVSLAKSGMYKLAGKAKDEADELESITMRSSLFGSSLDQAETQLVGARKQVSMATKSAHATKQIAQKTASAKGLAEQDALNDKIWKLLDPSNVDSLDATEKRVRGMEKAANKFRSQLRGEVRTVLVTKMRRSTGKLRKVIHRLGEAGNRASDGGLGETGDTASLGADLGLNDD